MVWLHTRYEGTEEGKTKWDRLTSWIKDPPVEAVTDTADGAADRVRVSRPEVLPSGAPLTADAQAAAFAAYEGA